MKALLLREIKSFWFANRLFGRAIPDYQRVIPLGFEGDYNILNTGFADMSPFFTLAPWILIFLIPAVTMRSFYEKTGTGITNKTLSLWQIVNGKFLALLLIVLAIIPTFIYVVISNLGMPEGNIDG
jgi:ABC-2 type transport system permease protein